MMCSDPSASHRTHGNPRLLGLYAATIPAKEPLNYSLKFPRLNTPCEQGTNHAGLGWFMGLWYDSDWGNILFDSLILKRPLV